MKHDRDQRTAGETTTKSLAQSAEGGKRRRAGMRWEMRKNAAEKNKRQC